MYTLVDLWSEVASLWWLWLAIASFALGVSTVIQTTKGTAARFPDGQKIVIRGAGINLQDTPIGYISMFFFTLAGLSYFFG